MNDQIRNLFFYGMLESRTAATIKARLDKEAGITYFRWPEPFRTLRLDDMENNSFDFKVSTDDKEVFKLEKILKESKSKNKYVVIENLHVLAHSYQNPNGFYKELLGVCNFYISQQNIFFVLSCAKIPAVFVKENPFIHRWEFVDCNVPTVDSAFDNKETERLFYEFRRTYPQLEWHHFIKIRERLGEDANVTQLRDPQFDKLVRGLIESTGQFSSDIYLQDRSSMEEPELREVLQIKEHLQSIIIGQDEAIQRVADATLLAYNSILGDSKSKEIFLFVGPSGVGKTRICQELARILPGYRFLQVNLAEHNDQAAVNKLIGLGRGYEDSEYGGILTEPVRLYPKHIILFDELDHAHPSVARLFYKIFEGVIMDGRGRNVSFKDCFIIMTSNKGQVPDRLSPDQQRKAVEQKLIKQGKEAAKDNAIFTQAFLGRIHSVIRFNELTPYHMLKIAGKYFFDKIMRPYNERFDVEILFESRITKPGLMEKGVLNIESAFFEIWALLATQDREQGARRLFQLMDEYLIQPLELFRIKYHDNFKAGFQVKILFDPFWPPVADYDNAAVLLIDDESDEQDKLEKILQNHALNVKWADFEENLKQVNASVMLLDLLKDGELVGKNALSKLKSREIDTPICIYSSLPHGPQLDQLKSSLWEYGISEYIAKNEAPEKIREKVFDAIRENYLSKKAKAKEKIERVILESPISVDEHEAVFVLKRMLA